MKILGTGLSGLVGSRVVELLSDKLEFESCDEDIRERSKIIDRIKSSNAPFVLHLAAKTDVDGCEDDRNLGKNSDAWRTNVFGTQNVAVACRDSNKKMIYISTDFVFDGKSKLPYREDDRPNPMNWYGRTKREGEKIVEGLSTPWIIARLAYPYRVRFKRLDFVRAIINKFKSGERIRAVSDHLFTPTFTDDIALGLLTIIRNDASGIYHIVGSQFLTPFDAAILICKKWGFNQSQVIAISSKEYFKNRAVRPARLALRNDKIAELGVKMKTFEEGLDEFPDFGTIGDWA